MERRSSEGTAKWRNGGTAKRKTAKRRNSETTELRNGEMAKRRNGEMAKELTKTQIFPVWYFWAAVQKYDEKQKSISVQTDGRDMSGNEGERK